jgi:hypothetical protein
MVNMNAAVSAFSPPWTILMVMINKHIAICTGILQSQHFLVALFSYNPTYILSVTVRHGTMESKQGQSLTETLRIDCGVNIVAAEEETSCCSWR